MRQFLPLPLDDLNYSMNFCATSLLIRSPYLCPNVMIGCLDEPSKQESRLMVEVEGHVELLPAIATLKLKMGSKLCSMFGVVT